MRFFSIILPTLNAADTVRDALASIASQSFTSYEVLLQDGGSTDNTLAQAATFAGPLGGRLKIQQRPDAGVYDAMNRAMRRAQGRWFYFLGADDVLEGLDVLQRMADEIRARPRVQVIHGQVRLKSGGVLPESGFQPKLLTRNNICHQAIFYRRDVLRLVGDYDLAYPVWADWDYNMRCLFSRRLDIDEVDLVVATYNDLSGLSHANPDAAYLAQLKALRGKTPPPPAPWPLWQRARRSLENWIDR
ncbi:MAG: glycosyltransferase [Chthoniobacterales bacterium]